MCTYTSVLESGFAAIFTTKVQIVLFAISNTSSNTVPLMNYFLGYHMADLFDLGQ